ncbi:hypothetical protein FRB95_004963 [Tulasnella sp. JGI-2019a]|nr:hypothetical protein FRB95_004963 [Tulasnella sp. JGI-2019a]
MDDYMVQALNIFSEGASRTAVSQLSLNDPTLTEPQRSGIMMRSFDDALKTFSGGLHRLRCAKAHHHNTLSPISRLPNDLLVEIFALSLKSIDNSMGLNHWGRMQVRLLATLVFVCHEWREIMHNAPSLWAYISSYHPYGANLECLARSGQVPLYLSLDDRTLYDPSRQARIFQEVHRWKSVEMSEMTVAILKNLEQRLAPLLEKLYILGDMETALNLFCGSAGRLRHLTLVNIRIPWESGLLSRLWTLRINYTYGDGPSARQVLHVLQSCPGLTSFELHLPPDLHPGSILPGTFTVELPRLNHLSIRVHSLMTEHLLQRIRIPSCKNFDVDQAEATGPTFSTAMKHLIPSLSSILLAVSRVNISITLDTLRYNATAKIDEDHEKEDNSNLDQFIHIQVSCNRFTDAFILETLFWLVDNLHSPSISSPISLIIRDITSSHAFMPIIDQLSAVITGLDLTIPDTATFISYLAQPSKVIVDGITTLRWPLPNLVHLSFGRCDGLEPEAILACVRHRAGREVSLEGRREHCEELPARLTTLYFPREYLTGRVMRMFPDFTEWCGLDLE